MTTRNPFTDSMQRNCSLRHGNDPKMIVDASSVPKLHVGWSWKKRISAKHFLPTESSQTNRTPMNKRYT